MSLIALVAATLQVQATISATWSDITVTSPSTQSTNEDRTISFGGGSRNVTCDYAGTQTLQYRIDSGSYVTYSGAFSVTSGQTVGWRYQAGANETPAVSVNVYVAGALLDTFTVRAIGF